MHSGLSYFKGIDAQLLPFVCLPHMGVFAMKAMLGFALSAKHHMELRRQESTSEVLKDVKVGNWFINEAVH